MEAHGDYRIRPYAPGDETELIAGFNRVFREIDPAFVPRDEAAWRWAYGDRPEGRRLFVAEHQGRIVAGYHGLPERVWIDGREATFTQVVDSYVLPEHRAGLPRPGLFAALGQAFFAEYGGPDKDLVHYGMPNPTAWKVGKRFLGYELFKTHGLLGREPGRDAGQGTSEAPAGVEVLTQFDEQVRWLWDRCAGAFGASIVRDAERYRWRFERHPRHRYTALGVRDSAGILRGVAVWRRGDWILPNMGLVVEWLVPPEEREVGELLLAAIEARGRAEGVSALVTLIPEWSPWFLGFQDAGWLVHPSDHMLVGRLFHPRYDTLWLKDHWWYQLADFDFV